MARGKKTNKQTAKNKPKTYCPVKPVFALGCFQNEEIGELQRLAYPALLRARKDSSNINSAARRIISLFPSWLC